ncbi:MAG TPA: hypothetical protein PLS20_02465, partial [Ruminococcus flavefaciens]|nr:hypothetical protein [Ruminococcus flavefaciens]
MMSLLIIMAYMPSNTVWERAITAYSAINSADISTNGSTFDNSSAFSANAEIFSDPGCSNTLSPGSTVSDGQSVYISFDWKMDPSFSSESPFTIRFDPKFNHAIMAAQSPAVVNNDQCTATYRFEDGYVYIDITPKPGHDTDFEGSGVIEAKVDASSVGDADSFELGYMGNTVLLNLPAQTCDIRKTSEGIITKDGDQYAQFKVTISNVSKDKGKVYVKDTFPSNGIYAYNAESPSSVLSDLKCGGTAIDSSAVKFNADTPGTVTMIFPEIENLLSGSTVEYTYALKLDPKKVVASVTSNVDSDNTALLYSSANNEKVNTNSDNTAYANIEKPVLNKTGVTDMTNKVVNWTITVDPKVLGGGDTSEWYILDKPGQNLTVDEVLEGISAAAPSAVKDGDSVKVNISDFTNNTDGSYTLTYSTAIPDEMLEIPVNTNIGNSFEMHFGDIILQGGTGSGNINNSGNIGDDYKFTKEVDHVENGVIWWKVNLAIPDVDKLTSINVRDAWETNYVLETSV